MCCRRTLTLICLLCVLCIPSFCQDAVLRIGVSVLRAGPKIVSGTEARDRLVKELNQHKRNKKLNPTIEAVPLENEWGMKAAAEAEQKQCQFVLSTHLTGARTSSVLTYNGAGSDMDSMPAFWATVEYRLIHLPDGAPFDVDSVKEDDPGSLQSAVWAALSHIAHQAIIELAKGGNVQNQKKIQPARAGATGASSVPEVFTVNNERCAWLPNDFPHADALRDVCQFANTVAQRMPNFICDQDASRYRGKNKVPFDLITASVRYQDGREFYSRIRRNGQPVSDSLSQSPGLWSTGEFSSNNLRSIFDPLNHAVFQFVKDGSADGRPVWIFSYRILKQNNPLWRLRTADQMVAPPYGGELWIDQQTGWILHFDSAATQIPSGFAIESASQAIDYENVAFGEAGSFLLPTSFVVATRYKDEEPTRNVVQFRSCHEFRATAHIVVNVPSKESETSSATSESEVLSSHYDLEQAEQLYAVLREQAIRDDQALLDSELRNQQDAATLRALDALTRLGRERRRLSAEAALTAKTAPPTPLPETTLKVSVRFVPVTVVLRDPKGNTVGDLNKENFELFDNGKPQEIKTFSIEKSQSTAARTATESATISQASPDQPSARPDRYVAYLFDDIHTAFEDLAAAREAAAHHLSRLQPEDRAAIFTTSGQLTLDFTNDPDRLQQALKSLRPHPIIRGVMCPPISPYMAELIVNQDDREALGLATRDAANCAFGGLAQGPGPEMARAEQIAKSTAIEVLSAASAENQSILSALRYAFHRTASAPGSRSIVLVSPGFLMLAPEVREAIADLTGAALHSEIVVNTLDVRGLVTPVAPPNQDHPANPVVRFRYDREEDSAQTEVLADLAYSTGGTFFHSNNDLDEGFRRTADQPEYIYVLGFSPPKLDGKFHKLKVRLNTAEKLAIQAREGYYALKPGSSH
ncbi:MAG: VWA domain-containing protein [Candidatus Sulfotelmatobacter sp.]